MSDFKDYLAYLKSDGFIVLSSLIDINTICNIKDEIKQLSHLSFNDQLGSLVISENLWIDHLGIHSELILKTILNEELLWLADNYFEEPSILGSLKYQQKIKKHKALDLHSDMGPGLVAFLFLNEIDGNTGSTRFLKGTHLLNHSNYRKKNITPITEYFHASEFKDFELISSKGGPGTVVLFSQQILHDLPKISKIGRETIWFTFYPKSYASLSENHLFSKNVLSSLTTNQKNRILFDEVSLGTSFTKFGNNTSIRDTHNISAFRIFYYVLYYKIYYYFTNFKRNLTKKVNM